MSKEKEIAELKKYILHRIRTETRQESVRAERERIRAAVEEEIRYMIDQGVYSAVEVDALRRALALIEREGE